MATASPDSPDDDDQTGSLTTVMEDYLRHIYALERASEGRVSNSTLADRLGVSQPTVTSMFDTLAERGLIDREPYRPIVLTPAGEQAALEVVRKHRLVETLLTEQFGFAISEVDAEADALEHHISDRLCREIDRKLGHPAFDPHGDPIPDAELAVRAETDAVALVEVAESTRVEVTRITTQDEETLSYLVAAGIEPAAQLTVEEIAPFGMVTVSVDGDAGRESLPESLATHILVRPTE
ncbi:metal-dependent transcriptional regulator [Haloarchaeobius sp. HME9146]|uniref:metal-dependent transcriptional regulator n=1 Tax=Haloarchaeobius sp. HME9146 TaxID=2978732 RepID=UPI0021BEE8F9|nr:metal-dependent transcriptional regulator [Haloarchaeobius sp. HME9146]MCT9097169.1 metal-dependent transcriptional regulator [Haloarchaeobius sp. HME9146]